MKSLFSKSLLSLLLFVSGAAAQANCPLGAKEDHLTIQRVMINFGKYVGQADHITVLGARYPNETVTEAQIDDVIAKLSLAMDCASAVIDDPTGDMLPTVAKFKSGKDLEDFVKDLVYFMTEFNEAVAAYQQSYITLKATPKAQRDWESLYAESKELNQLIDRSHRKTSSSVRPADSEFVFVAADLKANMKQMGSLLKTLSANLNAGQSGADQVQYVDQIVQLLAAMLNQFPETIDEMNSADQPAAKAKYQNMIRQVAFSFKQLREALVNEDKQKALDILSHLKDLKERGHDEFDP